MDPVDFRLRNAAKEGTQTHFGPKLGPIGFIETLERIRSHPHRQEKLGPNQGRGIASGFWFTLGAETSATLNIGEDGTATLIFGTVDVTGGSRAALAMIVAEELGIPFEKVRTMSGDTSTLGFNFMTAGSRGTAAVAWLPSRHPGTQSRGCAKSLHASGRSNRIRWSGKTAKPGLPAQM